MTYDEYGMHKNTRKILLEDIKTSNEEYNTFDNFKILATIDMFTIIENKIFRKLLKEYYNKVGYNMDKISYDKEKKKYCYKDGDKNIEFEMLSKNLSGKGSLKYKSELNSQKRKGQCHSKSIFLATTLKGSKIVTGYAYTPAQRVIHSVCQITKKGIDYILDYTRNTIMKKEDYCDLFKFEEITSINVDDWYDDIKYLENELSPIGLKTYLIFRDQLINELERKEENKESNKLK